MLHRKIIDPALAKLPEDRAAYFSDVVGRLEDDPRVQEAPNIVYLVLKETMPILPIELPKQQMVELLLGFVRRHRRVLGQLIFDRRFIANPHFIRQLTDDLIGEAAGRALDLYREGKLESGEPRVYRLRFPAGDGEFPYVDDDEEEADPDDSP